MRANRGELAGRGARGIRGGGWRAVLCEAFFKNVAGLELAERTTIDEQRLGRRGDCAVRRELDHRHPTECGLAQRIFAAAGSHAVMIADAQEAADGVLALQLRRAQQDLELARAVAHRGIRRPWGAVEHGDSDRRRRRVKQGRGGERRRRDERQTQSANERSEMSTHGSKKAAGVPLPEVAPIMKKFPLSAPTRESGARKNRLLAKPVERGGAPGRVRSGGRLSSHPGAPP
jgi:hypothetical protein